MGLTQSQSHIWSIWRNLWGFYWFKSRFGRGVGSEEQGNTPKRHLFKGIDLSDEDWDDEYLAAELEIVKTQKKERDEQKEKERKEK